MKKQLLFVLAPLVLFFTISVAWGATTSWYPFDDSAFSEPYRQNIVGSDMNQVAIVFSVPGLEYGISATKGGPFARIAIPGAGQTSIVGEPELPVIRQMVRIPFGAEVSLEVRVLSESRLDLDDLYLSGPIVPVQEPVEKVPGAMERARFSYDQEVYTRDAFVVDRLARVLEIGQMRGYRYAALEIQPVDYNPITGELSVSDRIEVRLKFKGADAQETRFQESHYYDRAFDALAARIFPNHDTFGAKGLPDAPSGYLIFAAERFMDSPELAAFVDWKRQCGYEVSLFSTADTSGDPRAIQSWINTAYASWEIPPAFVLLVGDTDDIGYFVGQGNGRPATDLYYSTPAGSDYIPDIWAGRLSVADDTDLANILNKTLSFEKVLWSAPDTWEKHAAFCASTDNFNITEGTHNAVISTYLNPLGYLVEKLYTVTYHANSGQVSSAINAGLSLLIYSGHEDVTYWADGPHFDQQDVRSLTNAVYPIVHSYACLTGKYQTGECFGETWIREDAAAVMFWGASVSSYWDEDDILERGVFEGFFNNQEPGDTMNLTWVAAMNNYGKSVLYNHYGNTSDIKRYFEMYNIMGDPSLDVWTNAPIPPVVVHAPTISTTEAVFDVQVAGVPNAMVGLSMDGVVHGVAYTDTTGNAAVPIRVPFEKEGQMMVTVTGHDLLPYVGTVNISDNAFILQDFHAEGGSGLVDIFWTVANEEEIAGYNLGRSLTEDGEYELVNTEGQVAPGLGGYQYTDYERQPLTTYYYKLEVIDTGALSTFYGPVEATTDEGDPAPPPDGDDDQGDDDDDGGNGCGGCSIL